MQPFHTIDVSEMRGEVVLSQGVILTALCAMIPNEAWELTSLFSVHRPFMPERCDVNLQLQTGISFFLLEVLLPDLSVGNWVESERASETKSAIVGERRRGGEDEN